MGRKKYPKEYQKEHSRKWYDKNRELSLGRSQKWYQENILLTKRRDAERWQILKTEVLSHYSNGDTPLCVACGENQLPCLSIDHINNDGYKEGRGKSNRSGTGLYLKLKKAEYPKGYQTLCANCQCIKRDLFNQEKRRTIPAGKVYGEMKKEDK